jgi:hypothetical protein
MSMHNSNIVVMPWHKLFHEVLLHVHTWRTLKITEHTVEIKLSTFASYLHYCGVEMVHLWTICINNLHLHDNVVILCREIIAIFSLTLRSKDVSTILLFSLVGSSTFACIPLAISSTLNPWTSTGYLNSLALPL